MPSRQGRSAEQPRATLYEEVTARIISELEHGIVPWVQPWGNAKAQSGVGLPCNAATRRSYSGINILILWGRLFDAGYPSQQWLTFRQAISLGGTVRKGEHGVAICYADKFVPKQRRTQSLDDPSSPPSGAGEPQTVAFLRRYTVFNVAQCDGLPDHCHAAPSPLPEREIVPEAEALVRVTLADIRHGGAEAYYECDQGLYSAAAAAGVLRPDQLLPHPVPRARALDGT